MIPRSLLPLYDETKRDELYYAFINCSEPFLAYTLCTGTKYSKSKKMSKIHEVNCLQFYSLYSANMFFKLLLRIDVLLALRYDASVQ